MSGKLTSFIARVLLLCALFQACAVWAGPPGFPTGATPPQTVPFQSDPNSLDSTYSGVPTQPIAPRLLKLPTTKDAFHCERTFLYKGQTYGCDSYVQRDAERLRSFVADSPEAAAEIDTYQSNRKKVRTAAYVGSIGLLIAIGGFLTYKIQGGSGAAAINVRAYSLGAGFGITVGSVIFGLGVLNDNESHLDRAVEIYNKSHPSTPIFLQFSTGFTL
jgi:hypothetical protein